MKKIIFLLFVVLFISTSVDAVNLEVTKDSENKINFGENLEVNIYIENLENSEINLTVKEFIGNADPIDPTSFISSSDESEYEFSYGPPYYLWEIKINSSSTYTIKYIIKPTIFGTFSLSPTQVETSSGEIFFSNSLNIEVVPEKNGICEPEIGENYITNPDDCPSGSDDGMCDLIQDGICDPDCVGDADSDCEETATTTTSPTTTTLPIKKPSKIKWYIIAGFVISLLIFLFIYQMKKQPQQQTQ